MVSHPHLSAANSESCQSHDIFAKFGISMPNSPPTLLSNSDDMMESDPNPLAISISSDDSTSLDKALEVNVGPALGPEAQDIFKVAQYFSRKDRDEALLERKRNM